MDNSALLVYNNTKLAVPPVDKFNLTIKNEKTQWNSKQRRCYHRIKSGMKRSKAQNKRLRFMTLTSKKDVKQKRINDDFQKLNKRIKRLTPLKLVRNGYIKLNEIRKYYPQKSMGEFIDFDYCKVETSEGGGVLHIIFKGDFIPQKWLSVQWNDIRNGSWNVDIRLCRDTHACYVVNQYLSGQNAFERYSWSWGWVYKGFIKNWYNFKKYFFEPLTKWNLHMEGIAIEWNDFDKWLTPEGYFIDYPPPKTPNKKQYPDAYFTIECLMDIPFLGCRKQHILWGGYE